MGEEQVEPGQGSGDYPVEVDDLDDIIEVDLTQQPTASDDENNAEFGAWNDDEFVYFGEHTANNALYYDPTGY